jgi:biotin synthase
MAGANAVFTGERMLTTPTSGWDEDVAMFGRWGITGLKSFEGSRMQAHESITAAPASSSPSSPSPQQQPADAVAA